MGRCGRRARQRLSVNRDDPDVASAPGAGECSIAERFVLGTPLQTDRSEGDGGRGSLSLGTRPCEVGRFAQAFPAWDAALAIDPDHAETLDGYARVQAAQHRYDRASDFAERLAGQPGWEGRGGRLLGLIRVELNDPPGVVEALLGSINRQDQGDTSPAPVSESEFISPAPCFKPSVRRRLAIQLKLLLKTPSPVASWLRVRAELQLGEIAEAERALADGGSYRGDHPFENEPAPFVGEGRCVGCHQSIAKEVLGTRHTTSYQRDEALATLPIPDRPIPDRGDPKIVHSVARTGVRIEVKTPISDDLHKLLVESAFGTTKRYVTMVGRDERGEYRASRISYHKEGDGIGWDISAGDQVHPGRGGDYLGKPVDAPFGIIRCLACHTTNVRFGKVRTGPETADRGIGCERCHGPGADHLAAVKAKFSDMAIVNPGRAPDATSEKLCASCHNLNDGVYERTTPREDPGWVRSPGKTMTWSRCYTESRGALRCLTCHDAHRDSDPSPTFYEAKCLSCHTGDKKGSVAAEGANCPVNTRTGCIECHMPKVPIELLHTSLTDHYIRVRKDQPAR